MAYDIFAFVVFELKHIYSATQEQVIKEIAYFTVLIWAQRAYLRIKEGE